MRASFMVTLSAFLLAIGSCASAPHRTACNQGRPVVSSMDFAVGWAGHAAAFAWQAQKSANACMPPPPSAK